MEERDTIADLSLTMKVAKDIPRSKNMKKRYEGRKKAVFFVLSTGRQDDDDDVVKSLSSNGFSSIESFLMGEQISSSMLIQRRAVFLFSSSAVL